MQIDSCEDDSISASSRTRTQSRSPQCPDRLYFGRLLRPIAQPDQHKDTQLCIDSSRDFPYLRPGFWTLSARTWYQADRRCATLSALYALVA
jgi:hypothetical protein